MRERDSRKGIIVIEYDDFLREILGNLLHKMGYYIVSGESIASVRNQLSQHAFQLAIVGENVRDFYGKRTFGELRRETGNTGMKFFLITEHGESPLVAKGEQIDVNELSVRKILRYVQREVRR